MRNQVLEIVIASICELNQELEYPELEQVTEDTKLHGEEEGLDSLSLVSLIVDIEGQVADVIGKSVALADEKAMSERNSPYRNVGALVDFIVERLESEAD